jgi:hypothetical protein
MSKGGVARMFAGVGIVERKVLAEKLKLCGVSGIVGILRLRSR